MRTIESLTESLEFTIGNANANAKLPSYQTLQAVLAVAQYIPTSCAIFRSRSIISSFKIPIYPKQPDPTPLFNPQAPVHAVYGAPRDLSYYFT